MAVMSAAGDSFGKLRAASAKVMSRLPSLLAVFLILATPVSALAQNKFFNANGVNIRYVEQGTGEPVVLFHGIGGSLQSWLDEGSCRAAARSSEFHTLKA